MKREYAVPQPYFEAATNATDLGELRKQLADAERTAARAQDWTSKTRAEQDAKQLRQQIEGAGVHRRAQRTPTAGNHERFATPVAYFAAPEGKATPTRRADNAAVGFEQLNRAVQFAREAGVLRTA
jgi:hypothetical protein